MEAISLMSLARRLRVSLPLALLAATILLSSHTLAPLQQSATDGDNGEVLPRILLQVWIPCSHLYGPPLLLALQPCDRLGTLWATVVFTSVCAWGAIMQIVSWPSVVHAFNTARAVLHLCAYLFWGTLFLPHTVRSMWQRDARWALNPRATLESLWWCWRGSTVTLSAIDAALTIVAMIYQQVDGTEAEAEAEAEAGADPNATAEAEPEPTFDSNATGDEEVAGELDTASGEGEATDKAGEADAGTPEAEGPSQLCACGCPSPVPPPVPAADGEAKSATAGVEADGEAVVAAESAAQSESERRTAAEGLEVGVAPCRCVCPPAAPPHAPFTYVEALATREPLGEPGPRLDLPMDELAMSLTMNMLVLLFALLLGPTARRCLRLFLIRLNGSPEAQSASVISAFMASDSTGPKLSAKHMREFAMKNLRGLPFDELRPEDLQHARQHTGRDEGDMLALHSFPCRRLDEIDAFVSHAWGDDFEQRYVALRGWATQFELEHGRCPVIWLDKACINQTSIEDSIKCLPIFLALSERLVVLGGPLWPTRLWCVIELFCFLRVGGDANAIVFLPLNGRDSVHLTDWSIEESQAAEEDTEMRKSLQDFEVQNAHCYDADRDMLLSAIESGYSTLDHFNNDMRKALMAAHQTAHARNWAGPKVSGRHFLRRLDQQGGWRRTPRPKKLLWQDLMRMAWRDLATIEMGRTPKTTEAVTADPVPTPMVATAADLLTPVVPVRLPVPLPAPLPALVPVPARVAPHFTS